MKPALLWLLLASTDALHGPRLRMARAPLASTHALRGPLRLRIALLRVGRLLRAVAVAAVHGYFSLSAADC